MKQSKWMTLDRTFLLKATLLAAMLVPALGLAVYARQEVDPTWYDPWATQTKVVVRPAKPPTHNRERRRNTGTVASPTFQERWSEAGRRPTTCSTLAEMKDGNGMKRMMLLSASLLGAAYTRG